MVLCLVSVALSGSSNDFEYASDSELANVVGFGNCKCEKDDGDCETDIDPNNFCNNHFLSGDAEDDECWKKTDGPHGTWFCEDGTKDADNCTDERNPCIELKLGHCKVDENDFLYCDFDAGTSGGGNRWVTFSNCTAE